MRKCGKKKEKERKKRNKRNEGYIKKMAATAIFFFGFIGLILLFIVLKSIKVFNEYERGVRFRLGKFIDVLNPGLNLVVPIMDSVVKVDLRTRILDVPTQDVITRDNAVVVVDAVIYYKVVDPKRTVLEVEDFVFAILKLAQTTLRSIIGEMELDDILSKRDYINERLRTILDEASDRWGVKAENVEIKEVAPTRAIQDAMNRQLTAERAKRAMVLEAEGSKLSKVLEAEGDRDANIARADGDKKAQILYAEGEAQAIESVANSAKKNLIGPAAMFWQLKTFSEVGQAPSTKFVIPMELVNLGKDISDKLSKK